MTESDFCYILIISHWPSIRSVRELEERSGYRVKLNLTVKRIPEELKS